jgi:predicted nucleic acid-binding protein
MVTLDASLALAWLFERAITEEIELARHVLERLATGPALVPPLWHSEITNVLVTAERRGVLLPERSHTFLARLSALPIETDPTPAQLCRERVLALARSTGLSAYDATYLEVSQRLWVSLASFDRKLCAAARQAGVPVLGSNS